MKNILVFGGTTEGRKIAEKLCENNVFVTYCVATEYGKEVIPFKTPFLDVKTGRKTEAEIEKITAENNFDMVIDATHPYAVDISLNIKKACLNSDVKYVRFLREESNIEYGEYANTIKEACDMAKGNVLAATGSKQIGEYTVLEDYMKRLYARVLPTEKSVEDCKKAGLLESHIIKSFGIVSTEENMETIKKYDIKTLITKDSGKNGGFDEKCKAAKLMGIKFIVIKRPLKESGFSFEEVIKTALGVEKA